MNIIDRLQYHADHRPNAAAIITRKRQLSFSELVQQSAQAARLLANYQLSKGDVVLVFLPVSVELYEVLLALFRLGLVAMFVDPQSARSHIDSCIQRCKPKAFIGSSKSHLLRLKSRALRSVALKFYSGFWVPQSINWNLLARFQPLSSVLDVGAEHAALITFTSGSTGHPKATVRTHGFLVEQHKVLEKNIGLTAGQVDLTTLPVFVLANLASGVTSLIADANLQRPGQIKARPVIRQIKQFKPERTAGSPAFYQCLAHYTDTTGECLDSFKYIYTGGAPVFPGTLRGIRKMSPQAKVTAVYGSTEAEPIAHIDADCIDQSSYGKMATGAGLIAGHKVDEIELRIIKAQHGSPIRPLTSQQFAKLELATGQTGEIVVSGKHVLKGYLDGIGDEETKFEVDTQKWHRTGDAGYIDQHDRLWLMGRCSALILDADGELYPFAVEAAVLEVNGIKHAAMILIDEKRVLVVQIKKGSVVDKVKIIADLGWASISRLLVVDRIPMDKRHNAKIDYPALSLKVQNL